MNAFERWRNDDESAQEIAALLIEKFPGRDDRIGTGDEEGKFNISPMDYPLDACEVVTGHLEQRYPIGVFPLRDDGTTHFACLDFNDHEFSPDHSVRDKAKRVVEALANIGLPCLVEISRSGHGVHVWLSFRNPVAAWKVRRLLKAIVTGLGIPVPVLFPDLDTLKVGQVGNCVNLPLFGKSKIVDPFADFEEVDPLEALKNLGQVSERQLEAAAKQAGVDLTDHRVPTVDAQLNGQFIVLPQSVATLVHDPMHPISKRWQGSKEGLKHTSQSTHAFSLMCSMVKNFVPQDDIVVAIKEWSRVNGFDQGEDDMWLDRQIRNAYEFAARTFRADGKR